MEAAIKAALEDAKGLAKLAPKRLRRWWLRRQARLLRNADIIADMIEMILEEEDFDWDDLDENDNPRRVYHFTPDWLRWKYYYVLLVYWDPLFEIPQYMPSCFRIFRCLLGLTPVAAVAASAGWLIHSYWRNSQYTVGACIVESLPSRYENAGNMDPRVRGTYIVRRSYPPTPMRPEGFITQSCSVDVRCDKTDYGATSAKEDDRCVAFQAWNWGDQLDCFFHKDDIFGELGERLYCLQRPSDLEKEQITVILSSIILVMFILAVIIIDWRQRGRIEKDALDEEQKAIEDEELAEAKKAREERETAEAAHHAARSEAHQAHHDDPLARSSIVSTA